MQQEHLHPTIQEQNALYRNTTMTNSTKPTQLEVEMELALQQLLGQLSEKSAELAKSEARRQMVHMENKKLGTKLNSVYDKLKVYEKELLKHVDKLPEIPTEKVEVIPIESITGENEKDE